MSSSSAASATEEEEAINEEEVTNDAAKKAKQTARLAALDAERKWKAEPIMVTTLPFDGVPGPINCSPRLSPLDAFKIIFPIDLLQHIVDDTNTTAKANSNKHGLVGGEVTMQQVCTYVSILMAMSINKKPALNDHWSQDPLFCTLWVHNKMPRDMWFRVASDRQWVFMGNGSQDCMTSHCGVLIFTTCSTTSTMSVTSKMSVTRFRCIPTGPWSISTARFIQVVCFLEQIIWRARGNSVSHAETAFWLGAPWRQGNHV
jgi:hypothetical protein